MVKAAEQQVAQSPCIKKFITKKTKKSIHVLHHRTIATLNFTRFEVMNSSLDNTYLFRVRSWFWDADVKRPKWG